MVNEGGEARYENLMHLNSIFTVRFLITGVVIGEILVDNIKCDCKGERLGAI
jgi:hypothetical protein